MARATQMFVVCCFVRCVAADFFNQGGFREVLDLVPTDRQTVHLCMHTHAQIHACTFMSLVHAYRIGGASAHICKLTHTHSNARAYMHTWIAGSVTSADARTAATPIIVMADIVMAYIVVVYIFMACIVVAYTDCRVGQR